ncbi:MAG: antibiotic biosynthesis monooxygenase [Tannerellaceae bacterium]|jgi:quinol monooxygenase YgiN|nr:antibiotic biosynthesis monooxygenase [Tannerellaceae bacterium]
MKKIGIILMLFALLGATSCKGGKKCCESEGEGKCEGKCACREAVTTPAKEKKVIVARLTIKSGHESAFIGIASTLVEATRQEEGNLFYALYQSPANPSEFIFYEEYKDEEAFQTHSSSPHFAVFAESTKDLTEGALIVDQF